MKRAALLTGGILLAVCIHAQVRDIDMSVMRARHAVDTLVQNDQYLDGRSDTLDARLDSLSFISALDSSAIFTTIDVDSTVTAVLDYEPPHGSFAFADSTFVLPLTVNDWAKVTNTNNDLFTAVDTDGVTFAGDTITIITPGDYMIWIGLSFSGGPSDVWHIAIYKNAVITAFEMHRTTSNNDTGNTNLNALLDNLAIGDDISIYMRNTGDNDDPTLISSQFMIYMIHPR